MQDTQRLRDLAAWYREFAERAGNPWIWEARVQLADDLDKEAEELETQRQGISGRQLSRQD